MEAANLSVTFGPAANDRASLSKPSRITLETLYRHPLAHNLEWADVVALFEKLGKVEHKSNNETAFRIGDAEHLLRRPHGKNLTTDEVMQFRHMLTRAGWAAPAPAHASPIPEQTATRPADCLVAIDHHEARLYRLDVNAADQAEHLIQPYDPHHNLHHLSHKDHPRERGQRAPEDAAFYQEIAQAILPGGRIVVIGHGEGHSNAAHHFTEFLRQHHPDLVRKLASEMVADLSAVTPAQLLVLARRALTP